MIDLSALDNATAYMDAAASVGKPLELALSSIDEDPDQPRKEFSRDALADMAASIRATGVRSPVSVRPHPVDAGRYMLNFGARRYRASKVAGRTTIPAFVDQDHGDYDQVIENLQREDLTAMELALFIERKQAEGSKPAEIAKRLGKQKAVITFHQALIAPPAVVEQAYASGRCTSARTLYELRKLYEKHPQAVEAWAVSTDEITRASIAQLALDVQPAKPSAKSDDRPSKKAGAPDLPSTPEEGQAPIGGAADPIARDGNTSESGEVEGGWEEIANPIVTVRYEEKAAIIMLHVTPSMDGMLHLKFEDGSSFEVAARECTITGIRDAADSPSSA